MKLFLDTNIFLRFLVPEDPKTHQESAKLFELGKLGKIIPYTSNIVIAEIIFTLTRTYKFPRSLVIAKVPIILALRNLTVIEKTNTLQAVELYKRRNIKFGDCLIATQVPKGVALCTYDTDFTKIPSISVTTPAEILKSIASSSNKS